MTIFDRRNFLAMLGTSACITDSTGTVVEQLAHWPFGETWYDMGSDKWKFTTYERDTESGNDYAMAPYNAGRLGRFTSPDLLGGSVVNPQSLNHYTYVGNDPINVADPTGLSDALEICGAGPAKNYVDQTRAGENYVLNGGTMTGSRGGGGGGIDYGDDAQSRPYDDTEPDDPDVGLLLTVMSCVQQLFDVQETSFTMSSETSQVNFSGVGPVVGTNTNNIGPAQTMNFSVASIPLSNSAFDSTCFSGGGGCILPDNFMSTYFSADRLGTRIGDQSIFGVQLYELGNALGQITGDYSWNQGSKFDQTPLSDGYALQECVLGVGNGFYRYPPPLPPPDR